MDKPASALDRIASSKIEDLVDKLKKDLAIIIEIHNMQQAVRVPDRTACIYLGELIASGFTKQIFHNHEYEVTEKFIVINLKSVFRKTDTQIYLELELIYRSTYIDSNA